MRSLISFAVLLVASFITSVASAQTSGYWTRTSSASFDGIIGFTTHSTLGIVALSSGGEVFHSSDNGKTWKEIASDLMGANAITTDAYTASLMYAATSNGVWSSSDGKDWTSKGLAGRDVQDIDRVGISNVLVAGTPSGYHLSADRGKSWETFNTGLASTNVKAVGASQSGVIYAGTRSGLFIYADGVEQWVDAELGNVDVRSILVGSGVVFAGTNNALFSGNTFNYNFSKILTTTAPVTAILHLSPYTFAGTTNGLMHNRGDGKGYVRADEGIDIPNITAIRATVDQHVLIGTDDGSIYRSNNPMGSLLAVESDEADARLTLYPNPANELTVLSFKEVSSPIRVTIVDLVGRTQWSQNVATGISEMTIPTAALTNGTYQILIEHAAGILAKSLVVSR